MQTHRKKTSHVLALLAGAALATTSACADGDLTSIEPEPGTGEAHYAVNAANAKWTPFEQETFAQIELTRNRNGALAFFGRTPSGGIRYAQQNSPNGAWSGLTSLDGWGLLDMAVAENLDGRLEVFALGGDRAIYHRWQTTAGQSVWSGWQNLGGSQLKDVAVGRNQDGSLDMVVVGGDNMVYEQRQNGAGGGFGGWRYVGGVGVTQIEVGTYPSGRLALMGLSTDGELFMTSQPSLNAAFAGWTTLGGWQLRSFDLTRNLDGRMEIVALGGDRQVYGKTQGGEFLGFGDWWSYGVAQIQDLDVTMGARGELNVLMVGGDGVIYHTAQNGPGAGFVGKPDLGGIGFKQVEAQRNQDGRLEVFALTPGGRVYRTNETTPGTWVQLPAAPGFSAYDISPLMTAPGGGTVTVTWSLSVPGDCTLYMKLGRRDAGSGSYSMSSLNASVSGSTSFSVQRSTDTVVTAGCVEGNDSGRPVETSRWWTINVPATPPPPPPPPTEETFSPQLLREQVFEGAVPYGAIFGQGIFAGKLTGLKNPNAFAISFIRANAPNTDCWGANSVTLASQVRATSADISKLYGSTPPSLPLALRACVNSGIANAYQVTVMYTHQ